ncbi:MAG: hypothetical protein BAJALOKI3v1_840003 [Promethearchaeota archaeon]|jgi:hypothetical protein|nr:MAG: hypothetical protein BAJALOKI3v1_840003 [Candidatus Lokiarchaeota archaeon]
MKYYSEDQMKNIRMKVEEEVLKWEGISTTKMFGCPCYKVNDKLFGFLVTSGIVLTKFPKQEKPRISQEFDTGPFRAGNRTMRDWVQIPIHNKDLVPQILPFLRKSYVNAKKD